MRSLSARALVAIAMLGLPTLLPTRATAASDPVSIFVEPGSGLQPVLSLIRSAKHSIRLEVYLLTERSVMSALAAAANRGVQVRVLLEEHPYGGSSTSAQTAYSTLQSDGVTVRWANENAFTYTHEKSMAVDGQVAGIFTLNLSYSGIEFNREFGVIDRQPADARTVAAIFDADWNRVRPSVKYGDLVVSPYNSRSDLSSIVDGARHTLDLYEEEVADSAIEQHLIRARRRGVRVRLITSESSSGVDELRSNGISVEIMAKPYIHAKAIVADGKRFFLGSENVSTTSLDHNREMGILRTDAPLAALVERTFVSDWTSAGGSSGSSSPPSAPSSTGPLKVSVTTSPTSVTRGQYLTIRAKTKPGAVCSITVTYPDGYVSRARTLQGSRTAPSSRIITWSWREGSTVGGTAHATVSCRLGSSSGSGTAAFTVST